MDMMTIFWLIWGLVLPILGIVTPIFALVIWFFIVPPLARKIAKKRFSDCTMLPIATDSGYVDFQFTKEELPEGVVFTGKDEVHFLQRPMWETKKERKKKKGKSEEILNAENLALKKYIVKGFGKPIVFGYAGKVETMNAAALAALHQDKSTINPEAQFQALEAFVKDLPGHFREPLEKYIHDLRLHVKAKKITYFDPAIIKQVIPRMTPPSLLTAYGKNRLMLGMKLRGSDLTRAALLLAGIIGLVILGVVAMAMLL